MVKDGEDWYTKYKTANNELEKFRQTVTLLIQFSDNKENNLVYMYLVRMASLHSFNVQFFLLPC